MMKPSVRSGFALSDCASLIALVGLTVVVGSVAGAGLRAPARASYCALNERWITHGVLMLTEDLGSFPPAYVFGADTHSGDWDFEDQMGANPVPANGFVHFSFWLREVGYLTDDAVFECPQALYGGAPNNNPGPNPDDWDPGQMDDLGHWGPTEIPNDRQAKRMAYTANAAIMPRNKFNIPQYRKNRLVGAGEVWHVGSGKGDIGQAEGSDRDTVSVGRAVVPSDIEHPARVTLLTEFAFLDRPDGWRTLETVTGRGIKSHRPLTPFLGRSSGIGVYDEPPGGPRFVYPRPDDILPDEFVGTGMIEHPNTILNAVGRHHEGGTAHFAATDGSVFRTTVRDTVERRLWGERFWSITGDNRVLE
ncbi:MAG: hypothetical protein IT431_08330 [Phycisphaerales bacterium]|nr:hypothetical protein [Phycisphaerales bacterium]